MPQVAFTGGVILHRRLDIETNQRRQDLSWKPNNSLGTWTILAFLALFPIAVGLMLLALLAMLGAR